MNCSERADNMSKCKLTDYFKSGNNKMLGKMLTVLFRMNQLSRLLLHKIKKLPQ